MTCNACRTADYEHRRLLRQLPGPLKNQRHEAFAKALFERPQTGMTQGECYSASGYKAKGHSAEELGHRLSKVEAIQARVGELQEAVAKKAVITVESICRELDEANAIARERGQAGAMVAASTLRAKLAGLLRDKVEVSGQDYSQYSEEDLAKELLRARGLAHPTQEQIEQALALVMSQAAEWNALVQGRAPITINAVAQPVNGTRRRLPSR